MPFSERNVVVNQSSIIYALFTWCVPTCTPFGFTKQLVVSMFVLPAMTNWREQKQSQRSMSNGGQR